MTAAVSPSLGSALTQPADHQSVDQRWGPRGMALSMRTAAMTAAVARVSVLRARLRAEAPSSSNASCSPSCSGLVAPASRAVSVISSGLALFNASIWRHRLGRKTDAEVREPDLCT